MSKYIEKQDSYSLISKATPLLANLNMKENIALIREVHHRLDIYKAEQEALEMLQKISLDHIADKRQRECSSLQRFYVMLIRAIMSDAKEVIIQFPFSIVHSALDINELIEKIKELESQKDIVILDTLVNKLHYDKISDQKVVIDAL